MRYLGCLLTLLIASSSSAQTSQICFASAETFYEQVYCQLQAKAQTKDLPPFHQFRKNSERVQYSLLKRPADRNAIKLPAPAVTVPQKAPSTSVVTTQPIKSVTVPIAPKSTTLKQNPGNINGCELSGKTIICAKQRYLLLGNKTNHRLAKQALSAENKMDLPVYNGSGLNTYLANAYEHYIREMDGIGLGGVTMTYGKFAYLYQDLLSKGLNFSQRFEIMFTFLRKDKEKLGVSESMNLPQGFHVDSCVQLSDHYLICDHHGRNYIFAVQ